MSERADKRLYDFVVESNRIEGILRPPTDAELDAHRSFLATDWIGVEALERFVQRVAGAPLRRKLGMNVYVGNHRPPPGSIEVEMALGSLCDWAGLETATPYELHVRYEKLHPFMDGNGRSGRVWWAWYMRRLGLDPFALPFLHRFYYQSLEASREGDVS